MVNLDSRLAEIKKMIDKGQYFCINRGRQYGKTTTISALEKYLAKDYIVVSMDFQGLSTSEFATEGTFVKAFARELWLNQETRNFMSDDIQADIKNFKKSVSFVMADLFTCISEWCAESERPVVLLIDEVDQASNNQIFLDFLAQLRLYYLKKNKQPTF